MCFLNESICIPGPLLVAIGLVALAGIAVAYFVIRSRQNNVEASMPLTDYTKSEEVEDQAPAPEVETVEALEEEEPKATVGMRILYDKSAGYSCYLVVDEVNVFEDETDEVVGHFEVQIPHGSTVIDLNYDREEDVVTVSFRMENGEALGLEFGVQNAWEDEEDDLLDNYDVNIDFVKTVPLPAIVQ